MCIQRVGGNCHQICNFFFLFKLSTLPSHFGLFLFLFFSSVNINKYKQSLLLRSSIWESIAAASDLFLLFCCILPCFVYFASLWFSCFLFTLFCFRFDSIFFRHILDQVVVFDVQVLLIVPRRHQQAGTSIGIYPDHFRGARGVGSLMRTPWSPSTPWWLHKTDWSWTCPEEPQTNPGTWGDSDRGCWEGWLVGSWGVGMAVRSCLPDPRGLTLRRLWTHCHCGPLCHSHRGTWWLTRRQGWMLGPYIKKKRKIF